MVDQDDDARAGSRTDTTCSPVVQVLVAMKSLLVTLSKEIRDVKDLVEGGGGGGDCCCSSATSDISEHMENYSTTSTPTPNPNNNKGIL